MTTLHDIRRRPVYHRLLPHLGPAVVLAVRRGSRRLSPPGRLLLAWRDGGAAWVRLRDVVTREGGDGEA